MQPRYDVIIVGGGLAGLTLARQLRLEAPSCRMLVVEKRRHPVPEAAHKVGESTVEIGANYYYSDPRPRAATPRRTAPQVRPQIFLSARRQPRANGRIELGLRGFSPIPSFQLDRGASRTPSSHWSGTPGRKWWTLRVTRIRLGDVRLGDGSHEVSLRHGRRRAHGNSTLGCRRQREGRAAAPPARAGASGVARRQRVLVAGVHTRRDRRLVRRQRVARADTHATAMAQHQSPDGSGLLGVVDSAWLWQHELRDCRGRGATSVSRIDRFDRARSPGCANSNRSAPGLSRMHASELQDFRALQNYAFGVPACIRPSGGR